MKTKINFLVIILSASLFIQSCLKDQNHFPDPLKENKLLLSKVSGQFEDTYYWGLNTFMYDRNRNFLESYSYGNSVWHETKPLQQIGFANTGTWDFTYANNFPNETIDNSVPGVDQGYWKYYHNQQGLIVKTGLAFNTTAEPTQFEFYTYDNNQNLTSLIYGTAVDTPFFKVTYCYDRWGDLDSFNYYYPIAYTSASDARNIASGKKAGIFPTLRTSAGVTESKLEQMKTFQNQIERSAVKTPGDANVIYDLYISAKIITDNKTNPFNQQGSFLFYQTNRYNGFNLLDFYIPLLKHNPVNVIYTLAPDFGGPLVATDEFTYTYNSLGYPDSLHQVRNDPNWIEYNNYTQDKKIAYIKNE